MAIQEKSPGARIGLQEIITRVEKLDDVFTCRIPQGLSFKRFLDQVPATYFAYLNRAGAVEKATLGERTIAAFPKMEIKFPDADPDKNLKQLVYDPNQNPFLKNRGKIDSFSEVHKGRLGVDAEDPRVQFRMPTFLEAIYLDRNFLNQRGSGLFPDFAIRTSSFLLERNPFNNKGGYELVEDAERVETILTSRPNQPPLLNIWVGRPYRGTGLIVDVALPHAACSYLYALYAVPIIVLTGK